MNKLVVVMGLVIGLLTSCNSSDLEDYQQALIETESYTSGVMTSELSIDLEFNEIGLEFEEMRDLSYFETIEMVTTTKYNSVGETSTAMMDVYFNFGGVGFDMIYYMSGNQMLIKLPIIDKYINVGGDTLSEVETQGNEHQTRVVKKVIDAWSDVLNDEDVFSGKKAYIMTDKGQIKTTTYDVSINSEQFEILKKAVLTIIEDEAIVESILRDSEGMIEYNISDVELQEVMKEFVEVLSLESFEGQGFVDFDSRLLKQIFTAELVNKQAGPGEVKAIHLTYESGYDQLGEVAPIRLPNIDPSDLLEMDDDSTIEDYFPKGIF